MKSTDRKGMSNENSIICLEIEAQSCTDLIDSIKRKIVVMEKIKELFSDQECENVVLLAQIIEKMHETVISTEQRLYNLIDAIKAIKKEYKFNGH